MGDGFHRLPSVDEFLEDLSLDKEFQKYVDASESKRLNEQAGAPTASDIRKAINNRQYIGIYYDEDGDEVKSGFRLIEPYVYGRGFVHPKTGNITNYQRQYLRAFVIRDTSRDTETKTKKNFVRRKSVSKTNKKPYWRLFRVDRIQNWETIPRLFSKYRESYNPDDKTIRRVISKISKNQFPYGGL